MSRSIGVRSRLLRLLTVSSFLAALSIVLGKYLAINIGDTFRLSFENLPVIFAGAAFGPVVGATVGAVADVVGCLFVGFAINPLITLGAAATGAVAGIYRFIPKSSGGVSRYILIIATVFMAHAVGSVLIKTAGLSIFYGTPYSALLFLRSFNYLVVGAAEAALLSVLLTNKKITREINRIMPRKKSPKTTQKESTV